MAKLSDMITTKLERRYETLNPEVPLTVGGKTSGVQAFAERYRPVFYVDPRLGPMRPDNLLYEAMSPKTRLILNYYLNWKDEVHPNPVAHTFYRGFRSVVYGSPRDIEFVQVRVSFRTGRVTSFAFERDPSGRPDAPSPAHDLVAGERGSDEEHFRVTVNGRAHGNMPVSFDGERLCVLVSSWNHIYDFYTSDGDPIEDPPLEPLTGRLYKKYYMARRSRPPLA